MNLETFIKAANRFSKSTADIPEDVLPQEWADAMDEYAKREARQGESHLDAFTRLCRDDETMLALAKCEYWSSVQAQRQPVQKRLADFRKHVGERQ